MLRRIYFIGMFFGFLVFVVQAQDVTDTVSRYVNAERSHLGLAPLVANNLLIEAAQMHSNDMAAGDFLSHSGSDGSQFWDRMRAAGYNVTSGAENVLYRSDNDPVAAFQQWNNSDGHRANMLNTNYAEIGVAYAVSESGRYYFTMLLGIRPDMQPQSTPTATAETIESTPTRTINPTETTFPTSTQTPIPTALPSSTPVTPVASPTPPNLSTAVPTQTVAPFATITAMPRQRIMPAPTATSPAQVQSEQVDIELQWDQQSFSLLIVAGQSVDLSRLRFESAAGSLSAQRWQTADLRYALSAFPNGDCLQVWGLGSIQFPSKPSDCTYRQAWIAVGSTAIFWRDVELFEVFNGDARVAMCNAARGQCAVNLQAQPTTSNVVQDAASLPTPVFNTDTSSNQNIQLVYDTDSFTILNRESRSVNLSNMIFSSNRGEVSIFEWDNGYLSADLFVFPPGDCLQAWHVNDEIQAKPTICDTRHAWIAVGERDEFWLSDFTVKRSGETLAVCEASAGLCSFNLP